MSSRSVPPHNLDAEQAVLGGVLMSGQAALEVAALLPEDFYSPAHQHVFNAIQELNRKSQPVDLLTVAEELDRQGLLESAGGRSYLAELDHGVVSAANARYFAEIVKEKAIQRRLIEAATKIISACHEPAESLASMLDQAQADIFGVVRGSGTDSWVSAQTATSAMDFSSRIGSVTIQTGFAALDDILVGIAPTDLIILAGRPGMGKTAFALSTSTSMAESGYPVALFSLEMSRDQLISRALCGISRINTRVMRVGDYPDDVFERLMQAADHLSSLPIYIDDSPRLSIAEIKSRSRVAVARYGARVVVIDYLGFVRSGRKKVESQEQETAIITGEAKALAKELNVPVILLAQLNREVEKRPDKRPRLSDLRYSGAIEQDADTVLLLYNEAYYKADNQHPPGLPTVSEIIVAKSRHGTCGTARVHFHAYCTTFADIPTTTGW